MTNQHLDQHDWLLNDEAVPTHTHDDRDPVLMCQHDGSYEEADLNRLSHETRTSLFDDLRTTEVHDEGPKNKTARRTILKGIGGVGLGALLAASAQPRYSYAAVPSGPKGDILVVIFLRFGFDGLTAVPPLDDPHYARVRPTLATRPQDTHNLDGKFGLHQALGAMMPMWDEGSLAVVHSTGKADQTKSHFVAQDIHERAAPVSVRSGWVGRHLATSSSDRGTFRAITHGNTAAASMTTTFPTLAVGSLATFNVNSASGARDHLLRNIDSMYGNIGGEATAGAKLTLNAIDTMAQIRATGGASQNGAKYPSTSFGTGLKEVAQMVRHGIGLETASVDFSDWDMHVGMGTSSNPNGWMYRNLKMFGDALAAFRKDLGKDWSRVTVVTTSEFGRTGTQNAEAGLDHGTGNIMFVAGGGIKGGKVYGEYRGMAPDAVQNGDLAITTDYRTVLSEVVEKRLRNPKVDQVFPGFTSPGHLGITK